MMLSMLSMYEQNRNDLCFLCSNPLCEIKSYPNACEHLFHYKCLRSYVDNKIEKNESIICPICSKIFHQIGNKYKKSKEILFQNVILSNDETQCCICFSKYKCPVASTDSCSHTFCFDCLKKWCTFKHECPMDRMPIKLLLMSDFPGGHITKKEEPPPIEQDLNGGDGDNDEILNTACEICNLGNNDHLLLLCDNCNRGYHIYCLTVPLPGIPEGDWFCEECSNDIVSNERLPRGIRGLHRVIDDLQIRYDSNMSNRTNNNTNVNRRNRTRIARDTNNDDSDWDEDEVEPRRTQRTVARTRAFVRINSREEGIRRSLRIRRLNSDDEDVGTTLTPLPLQRRQTTISDINTSNNDVGLLSRGRRRVIEDSEEESASLITPVPSQSIVQPTGNLNNRRTRINNSRAVSESDDNDKPALSNRNRQGSLSSEPESEIEPLKKKLRFIETSSSSSSSTSMSASASEEDESSAESAPVFQVRTRKRVRDTTKVNGDDDDCPLPRSAKKRCLIDETSESNSDESNETDSDFKEQTSEESVESSVESSAEPEEEARLRHFSTSSSLSTIPCRTYNRSVTNQETAKIQLEKTITKATPKKCAKVEDIFSDSSSSDNTDSDYDPCNESMPPQPSTSKRPSKRPSKAKVRKRKVKKTKKTKRTTKRKTKKTPSRKTRTVKKKRKSSSRKSINTQSSSGYQLETNGPRKLSLFGREKQLPVVSDEELNLKVRVPVSQVNLETRIPHASTSILSEINEAQNNFRHISFSTVTRLSDGTLVPKSRSEHKHLVENKDPNNVSQNGPSTSSQSISQPVAQSSVQIPVSLPIVQSSNRSRHSDSNTISSSSTSSQPSIHIKALKKVIRKCVYKYPDDCKLTDDERKSLSERIIEKIMTRNNQAKIPAESSVIDFSKKYIDFYIKKKK